MHLAVAVSSAPASIVTTTSTATSTSEIFVLGTKATNSAKRDADENLSWLVVDVVLNLNMSIV